MSSTKPKLHTNIQPTNISSPASGEHLVYNGSNWANVDPDRERCAVFNVAGEQATGLVPVRFYFPFSSGSLKATRIRATLNTAPTGANFIAVLRRYNTSDSYITSGSTVISASGKVGSSATLTNEYLSPGYRWMISVQQVGSTVAGTDLTFEVVCEKY
jgi:hypothetical protein